MESENLALCEELGQFGFDHSVDGIECFALESAFGLDVLCKLSDGPVHSGPRNSVVDTLLLATNLHQRRCPGSVPMRFLLWSRRSRRSHNPLRCQSLHSSRISDSFSRYGLDACHFFLSKETYFDRIFVAQSQKQAYSRHFTYINGLISESLDNMWLLRLLDEVESSLISYL